jgi:integrase
MSRVMVELSRKYRYVIQDMDRHGNVRFYLRRPGHTKIRLRASPHSSDFDTEYQSAIAETGGNDPHPCTTTRTYRWLCHQYFQSVEFKRLDLSTQRTRRLILESTWDEPSTPGASTVFGDCPLDRMTSKLIRILRDRKADYPHAANGRVKAIRRVFKWAIEAEHVDESPAQKVAYLQTPPGGHHTFTNAEIEQFEAHWAIGTKPRLAFALLRYLGIRRSDVVRLGKQHLRDGLLIFTVKKGERRAPVTLQLPVPPALQSIIDASPTGDLAFLVTEYGRSFAAAGFGNWFRDRCNEAGLPECSAHGLRKAAATALAEAGASPHQLMSWFGWKSL